MDQQNIILQGHSKTIKKSDSLKRGFLDYAKNSINSFFNKDEDSTISEPKEELEIDERAKETLGKGLELNEDETIEDNEHFGPLCTLLDKDIKNVNVTSPGLPENEASVNLFEDVIKSPILSVDEVDSPGKFDATQSLLSTTFLSEEDTYTSEKKVLQNSKYPVDDFSECIDKKNEVLVDSKQMSHQTGNKQAGELTEAKKVCAEKNTIPMNRALGCDDRKIVILENLKQEPLDDFQNSNMLQAFSLDKCSEHATRSNIDKELSDFNEIDREKKATCDSLEKPLVEIFIEEDLDDEISTPENVETLNDLMNSTETEELLKDASIIVEENSTDDNMIQTDNSEESLQRNVSSKDNILLSEESIEKNISVALKKENSCAAIDQKILHHECLNDHFDVSRISEILSDPLRDTCKEDETTPQKSNASENTSATGFIAEQTDAVDYRTMPMNVGDSKKIDCNTKAKAMCLRSDDMIGSSLKRDSGISTGHKNDFVPDKGNLSKLQKKSTNNTDDEDDEVMITCVSSAGCLGEKKDAVSVKQESKSPFSVTYNLPRAPEKPVKPLTPYIRYKQKIFPSVKREFPNLYDKELNLIINNQWNMIKEEEKQEFNEEYSREKIEYQKQMTKYYASAEYKAWIDAKNTLENAMSCRIKLPKLTESAYNETEKEDESKKTGQCNWCKNVGGLSNFSANLQGKEIFCTGLCSQKCFKEASMKICNLENGGSTIGKSTAGIVGQTEETRATEDGGPAQITSGPSSPTTNPLSNFVWQQYLQECSSQAAPWQYFCQAQKPLQNDFTRGMKLEAKDPRQDEAVCVATVVGILGPRLRLRFDGSDTTNDIWRLIDSEDIHPVGWAEKNGAMLHPPVGFRWDVGKFPEFLSKTLNDAHVANPEMFVETPPAPTDNLFQVGMKLEAVDRVNPALVCVASVIDVKENRIHVEFDGYKGSGYWCHYGDRDIFPAGWCFNNGYPLQPPGKKAYQILSKEKGTPSLPATRPQPKTSSDTPSKGMLGLVAEPKTTNTITTAPQLLSDADVRSHFLNVIVYLNSDCSPGPYLNKTKLSKLSKIYSGKGVVVMQSIIEDIISCAHNPKVVFGFLRPVVRKTNCVITSNFDGVQYRCCLPNVEHMSVFWKTLEQFVDNLRCCENLVSATPVTVPCVKCNKSSPYPFATAGAKRSIAVSSSSLPTSVYQSTSPAGNSFKRAPLASPGVTTSAALSSSINGDSPHSKRSKLDASPIEINKPPRYWSIDEVARFIEQTDLREHAGLFKINEIDGKALLLLRRDIVLNYMGFKLGPAVKLLEIVDELREIQKSVQ